MAPGSYGYHTRAQCSWTLASQYWKFSRQKRSGLRMTWRKIEPAVEKCLSSLKSGDHFDLSSKNIVIQWPKPQSWNVVTNLLDKRWGRSWIACPAWIARLLKPPRARQEGQTRAACAGTANKHRTSLKYISVKTGRLPDPFCQLKLVCERKRKALTHNSYIKRNRAWNLMLVFWPRIWKKRFRKSYLELIKRERERGGDTHLAG